MPTIDFTKEDTRQLHRALLDVYTNGDRLVALLQSIGISPGYIPFKETLRDTWQAVLLDVHNRMKVDELLDAVLADARAATAHPVVRDFRRGTSAPCIDVGILTIKEEEFASVLARLSPDPSLGDRSTTPVDRWPERIRASSGSADPIRSTTGRWRACTPRA